MLSQLKPLLRIRPFPINTFRLLIGWLLIAVIAYFMWAPGDWPIRLLVWVLLTILADECSGWLGYAGLLLGGLAFFAPSAPPMQWLTIAPLVGGALLALLLVKHSGGILVLPFAAALFMLPLTAATRITPELDPSLTLPSNITFQRCAAAAMLAGIIFSFIRQVISMPPVRQVLLRLAQAKGLT